MAWMSLQAFPLVTVSSLTSTLPLSVLFCLYLTSCHFLRLVPFLSSVPMQAASWSSAFSCALPCWASSSSRTTCLRLAYRECRAYTVSWRLSHRTATYTSKQRFSMDHNTGVQQDTEEIMHTHSDELASEREFFKCQSGFQTHLSANQTTPCWTMSVCHFLCLASYFAYTVMEVCKLIVLFVWFPHIHSANSTTLNCVTIIIHRPNISPTMID